jgi:acyl carrier protein
VLADHPELKAAAVIAKSDPAAEMQLIAYIVPKAVRSPNVSSLRKFLLARLPDYMVPIVFETVDVLPLTQTGKIDRRALPKPGMQRHELAKPFAAPRTPAERDLSKIWGEVLGFDQVGIHDSFLDLGGHSLAASRIIARLIQSFQLELPLKALFDAPTVAEMAAVITQNQTKQASDAELAQMLREVEAMTEEEAQRRVDEIDSTFTKK